MSTTSTCSPDRNVAWEGVFYENLASAVERLSGMDAWPLLALTQDRMGGIGAEQYGDSSFLTDDRDLIKELRDEAADLIAYVVMETQKIHVSEDELPGAVAHLFQAAVHACIADAHARAARKARKDAV